ncbi:hypothetical protein KW850_16045 [Bacillus sp. sid0103]|nr:hypothetical protein [Bacillus sp. sid0103]MBV7506777.1 hypothetical protein [Bacillus sp. sid0103]
MGDYQKLVEYIPYFENEEVEFCKWNLAIQIMMKSYENLLIVYMKQIY